MTRVLLGVTGSVAAIRTPELARVLRGNGTEVRIVATDAARHFLEPAFIKAERKASTLLFDADEWPEAGYRRGDPVLHIELRRWAEVLVIAPLDAHTLAKLALGLCDNLLTCVWRAWDWPRPVLLAPAMNTRMWDNPSTYRHLGMLLEDHGGAPVEGWSLDEWPAVLAQTGCPIRLIPPQTKRLACGDLGTGAMAEVVDIANAVADWNTPIDD